MWGQGLRGARNAKNAPPPPLGLTRPAKKFFLSTPPADEFPDAIPASTPAHGARVARPRPLRQPLRARFRPCRPRAHSRAGGSPARRRRGGAPAWSWRTQGSSPPRHAAAGPVMSSGAPNGLDAPRCQRVKGHLWTSWRGPLPVRRCRWSPCGSTAGAPRHLDAGRGAGTSAAPALVARSSLLASSVRPPTPDGRAHSISQSQGTPFCVDHPWVNQRRYTHCAAHTHTHTHKCHTL